MAESTSDKKIDDQDIQQAIDEMGSNSLRIISQGLNNKEPSIDLNLNNLNLTPQQIENAVQYLNKNQKTDDNNQKTDDFADQVKNSDKSNDFLLRPDHHRHREINIPKDQQDKFDELFGPNFFKNKNQDTENSQDADMSQGLEQSSIDPAYWSAEGELNPDDLLASTAYDNSVLNAADDYNIGPEVDTSPYPPFSNLPDDYSEENLLSIGPEVDTSPYPPFSNPSEISLDFEAPSFTDDEMVIEPKFDSDNEMIIDQVNPSSNQTADASATQSSDYWSSGSELDNSFVSEPLEHHYAAADAGATQSSDYWSSGSELDDSFVSEPLDSHYTGVDGVQDYGMNDYTNDSAGSSFDTWNNNDTWATNNNAMSSFDSSLSNNSLGSNSANSGPPSSFDSSSMMSNASSSFDSGSFGS